MSWDGTPQDSPGMSFPNRVIHCLVPSSQDSSLRAGNGSGQDPLRPGGLQATSLSVTWVTFREDLLRSITNYSVALNVPTLGAKCISLFELCPSSLSSASSRSLFLIWTTFVCLLSCVMASRNDGQTWGNICTRVNYSKSIVDSSVWLRQRHLPSSFIVLNNKNESLDVNIGWLDKLRLTEWINIFTCVNKSFAMFFLVRVTHVWVCTRQWYLLKLGRIEVPKEFKVLRVTDSIGRPIRVW